MRTLIYFLLLSLGVLVFSSCQKTSDWTISSNVDLLVVEGGITSDLKRHQVKLSNSASYFETPGGKGVSGATVSISDGSTSFALRETNEAGVYETVDEVQGVEGRTYTLNIDLSEPLNQETNYTASARMEPGFTIDSTLFYMAPAADAEEEDDFSHELSLVVYGREREATGDYYIAHLYYKDRSLTDTITDAFWLHDDYDKFDSEASDFYFLEQYTDQGVNDPFVGDRVTVEMHSISKQYYDYINALSLESEEPDPLGMSGPPANLKGNVSGGAVGFFTVSSVTRATDEIYEAE